MKKLLIFVAALGAVMFANKKWRESKVVKTTWSKATDSVN
ncbi:DLW-39 family protein [Arthrobacter sp. H35-D1]|nr:DLW-39 family protein [Arthrobacter sp. H35-D1]MDJ0312055.1 DLW-39 family protein [Arthrobacter sp. H35-D1]